MPLEIFGEKEERAMLLATDYISNSGFLTAADVGDKPETWTIAAITAEVIGRDNPAKKVVLSLADANGEVNGRRLVLNKTNLGTLAKAFGNELQTWVGRPIRIQSNWTTYRGDRVRGIIVTPAAVALRAAGNAGRAGAPAAADTARRPDPTGRKDDFDDAIPF
jgi:hypothetical protein